MAEVASHKQAESFAAYNYCVCFVDLLGQRKAMEGQTLLPPRESPEQEQAFRDTIKKIVGPIIGLQGRAETMVRTAQAHETRSERRELLQLDQRETWDRIMKSNVRSQYWSDGLVYFSSLGEKAVDCHTNEIYSMIALAGSLALLGLAGRQPLRGAIEISWGMEIRPGELYGPAIANAYLLESELAGYPRIVVGPHAYQYLSMHSTNSDDDIFRQVDRELATLCLSMLMQDTDGALAVDYLGDAFRNAVTQATHADLYNLADAFVAEQCQQHQGRVLAGGSKLAFRYAHLASYFNRHRPRPPPVRTAAE